MSSAGSVWRSRRWVKVGPRTAGRRGGGPGRGGREIWVPRPRPGGRVTGPGRRPGEATWLEPVAPADGGRGHVAERVGEPAAVAGGAGAVDCAERVGHDGRSGRTGVA